MSSGRLLVSVVIGGLLTFAARYKGYILYTEKCRAGLHISLRNLKLAKTYFRWQNHSCSSTNCLLSIMTNVTNNKNVCPSVLINCRICSVI